MRCSSNARRAGFGSSGMWSSAGASCIAQSSSAGAVSCEGSCLEGMFESVLLLSAVVTAGGYDFTEICYRTD
jgi:hypothetical protein